MDKYWNLTWDLKGYLEPLLDINEEGDRIVISVDLPCVRKEDIELYATKKSIEIKAKMRKKYKFERWGTTQRGATFRFFRKVLELPVVINPEKIKTEFNKGILRIELKKIKKKIKIEVE